MLDVYTWATGFRVSGVPRGWTAWKGPMIQASAPLHYLYGSQPEPLSRMASAHLSEVHAYAILAYVAGAVFAISDQHIHFRNALEYSTKCISALRASIDAGYAFHPEEAVLRLLKAEVVAKNYGIAKVHARFLSDIVYAQVRQRMLDHGFLARLLFQTNNLSIAVWEKSSFTASAVETFFRDEWSAIFAADIDTVSIHNLRRSLEANLSDPCLCRLLGRLQQLFALTVAASMGDLHIPPSKWYCLMSLEQWLQLALVEYVQDQEIRLFQETKESDDNIKLNLIIGMGALLALRIYVDDVSILTGRVIFPQSLTILEKLSIYFPNTKWSGVDVEEGRQIDIQQYSHAEVWVAFIAAIVEARLHDTLVQQQTGRAPAEFWKQQLVGLIAKHKICSWKELRSTYLTEYPYTDKEIPLPSDGWLNDAFIFSREEA